MRGSAMYILAQVGLEDEKFYDIPHAGRRARKLGVFNIMKDHSDSP